jgi:hypothetical protein
MALVLTSTAQAEPIVTVSFSYRFLDKTTISGTVEGNLSPDGDTVTGLHNIDAVYSGQPKTPLTFVTPNESPGLSLSGTQPLQFEGFAMDTNTSTAIPNFGFYLANDKSFNVTVGTFTTSRNSLTGVPPFNGEPAIESEPFILGSYHAEIIPEPSSVALAGTGIGLLIGYYVYHYVLRKAAAKNRLACRLAG